MLPYNDHTINELRKENASSSKEIFAGNWESFRDLGWRYESNHDTGYMINALEKFRALQRRYGIINVTIGQAWDEEKMMPQPKDKWVAFYVRDVNAQVYEFRRELENFTGFDDE